MRRIAEMRAQGGGDGIGRRSVFYDIGERRDRHPEEYRADAGYRLALDLAAAAHRQIAAGGFGRRLVPVP